MRYELIIDDTKEESIVITAHYKNNMIIEIEKILKNSDSKLVAYGDDEVAIIDLKEVSAFYTNNGKVFISVGKQSYYLKERIYQIEEIIDSTFIKINQGCIVNIDRIKKFDCSLVGSIKVVMRNGFSDYISRRELKNVKRRLGL